MRRITYCLFITLLLSIIISATSKAQITRNLDPPQYGKHFSSVPDRRDVTMYQVNTRAFSKNGDFKGVIVRLDSIKALGVNVIYLMPIFPVGSLKAVNSPYATKDFNAVGNEFGTLHELRKLVDGAHDRKMAVIVDWVANHTSWDNPWIANKDWYEQDTSGNIKYPYNWRDVAQLNFKNTDMRLAMIRAMKSWVLKANIDGFRCDYADGPPVDFWAQAFDTLKNIHSHKLLLMAEGARGGNFDAGFDYNFGFRFYEALKRIYKNGKSVKLIDTINTRDYANAKDGQEMIRYITNHDVNSSDGTPLDLFGGKNGSMAAFIVVAYMKSVPMIYNGQEVGNPDRLTFPFTTAKIDWTLNPEVTAQYKKVIAFRNISTAIRRGTLISYSSDDVCVFTKQAGTETILVLSNLRDKPAIYPLPAELRDTKWKNVFTGVKITLTNEITIEPYQYLVLKK